MIPYSKKPLISAHRGAADVAPENTIYAIEKAIDLGIPMIELDVRSSLDGILYNLHDSSVNRTTNGKGRIRWMRSERIEALEIEDPVFSGYCPCSIPRIEAILSSYGRHIRFYFDVKKGVKLENLLSLIYKYQLEKTSLFWFKDASQAVKLKRIDPALLLKINVAGPGDLKEKLKVISANVIEIAPTAYSETLLQLCRERNVKIMVNFLNQEELFVKEPEKWPVDIINIHRVLPLLPYLQKQK